MNPATIAALGGISGFLGLVALFAYVYLQISLLGARRSIGTIIGGQQIFTADQVLEILSQFEKDHQSRLEALKVLTRYDTAQARQLLSKIEGKINVRKVEVTASKSRRQLSLIGAFFLLCLSGLALAYVGLPVVASTSQPGKCNTQQSGSYIVSLHYRVGNEQSKEAAQAAQKKLAAFGFSVDLSPAQDTGFQSEGPRVDWFRDPTGTEASAADAQSMAGCIASVLDDMRPSGWQRFKPHEEKWLPLFTNSQAHRLGVWF